MSSITDLYRQRRAASVAQCEPPPALCSTCGMLECVCRPRFFAGQVLTADDLNRLDAYIRAKHRLHNRQLHGYGVVNGLEVTCNPCGDGVSVSCGYALSPCGEDIVVCDTVTVDVCSLINRCEDPAPPCDPPRQPRQGECSAGEEEWILAIRYAESPTRGVMPLYGTAPPCPCGNAGCGGKAAGCGCNGNNKMKCSCKPTAPRGAPVQCEPTVICEGYEFEVYRVPPSTDDDERSDSALIERFMCCMEALNTGAPQPPTVPFPQNLAGWQLWAVRFKAHLLLKLQARPGTNCELLNRLAALVIPPADTTNTAPLAAAIQLLLIVYIDALLNCFCSALLPPCPMPSSDSRIALASLHIATRPCRVLRVCNWSIHRQIAVTMPALNYWLGIFPCFMRELLQQSCCFDLASLIRVGDDTGLVGAAGRAGVAGVAGHADMAGVAGRAGMASAAGPAAGADNTSAAAALAQDAAMLRLNPRISQPDALQGLTRGLMQSMFVPRQTVTADALAQGLLGFGKGEPIVDRAGLPQWLLLNQLARPAAGIVGSEFMSVLGGGPAGPAPDDDSASLRGAVDALAERVQKQEYEIAELRATRASAPTPSPPARRGKK